MAKLYIKFNTAVIKEVLLEKDEYTFGRKSDNDIVIEHPTISGHHGKIRKDGDRFKLEDLNSTNGTFINGKRVKTGEIKDRDQIGVAGHILDFYMDDSVKIEMTPEVKSHQSGPLPKIHAEPEAAPEPEKPEPATGAQQSIAAKQLEDAEPAQPASAKIRVISGVVDGQTEIFLKDPVTYIGTKPPATIKIKGFLAPDLAAAISRRQNDYFLKAIKSGYPKVNGMAVKEQVLLENGAVIEMAGSYMIFVKTH
jgi:predicted component of type VI protein secretion system